MEAQSTSEIQYPTLTRRQIEVLERVAKRRTLKQIAGELSISESAVNQHIKALKQNLGVNSLTELAESHHALAGQLEKKPCRNPASIKSGLPPAGESEAGRQSDVLQPVAAFHDSLTYKVEAPWLGLNEPKVVPGVLTGTNAKLARMAYIIAVAFGLFAVILLGLGVAQGVTMAFSQSASPGVNSMPAG